MSKKAIITCAITGGVHTPSMSPYLPITPEQITAEAVAAAEAGAAIIHLHARDPETGRPDQSPERFMEFLPRIKQQTDAILNITTGGGQGMTMEERLAPALVAKPELASMNMGSFNFDLSEAVERIPTFKYDWETHVPGEIEELHPLEHLGPDRARHARAGRERHALRVRVLRGRPSLQPGLFRRTRPREAAVLHPVHLRHFRRRSGRNRRT